MDFIGINIYQPTWVRADASEAGYAVVPNPSSYPTMLSDWLSIGPEAMYWGPKLVAEIWKVAEIYITENGAPSADTIASDGHIYDTDRVMFFARLSVADATRHRGFCANQRLLSLEPSR